MTNTGAINISRTFDEAAQYGFSLSSLTKGRTNTHYSRKDKVRGEIAIYSPNAEDLNDYNDGSNPSSRYGVLRDVTDDLQVIPVPPCKSFNLVLDKSITSKKDYDLKAPDVMAMQVREKIVPYLDKLCFTNWTAQAGEVVGMAKPTTANVIQTIQNANKAFGQARVPNKGRFCYLDMDLYYLIFDSPQFLNYEKVGSKALETGVVGKIGQMEIVPVPSDLLPEGVYMICTYKDAVTMPFWIDESNLFMKTPQAAGPIITALICANAAVLDRMSKGVYVAASSSLVLEAPTVAIATNQATVTAATGATAYYTTDNSDPRYSVSAKPYTAKVTLTAGQTIRVYQTADGKYPSALAEATN